MESYEILAVAETGGDIGGRPSSRRGHSRHEIPDFNRALNRDGGLDGCKALRIALTSPNKTARLLGANEQAMNQLAKALEIVLPADCFSAAHV